MKILELTQYRLFPQRYIIQLSPVRTGSTLVYNLLRGVLEGKKIVKKHRYRIAYGRLPIVATVRDPFDAIASVIRLNKLGTDRAGVEQAADIFLKNGAADIVKIKDKPNVLILQYERFIEDFGYVFSELEAFFDFIIPDARKQQLALEFNLDNTRKIAGRQKRFGDYDSVTLIHGDHISDHAKTPGYAIEMFDKDQVRYLSNRLASYMQAFGYSG